MARVNISAKVHGGITPPSLQVPEGASVTCKIGALLVYSSGTGIEATSPYVATNKAIGFAEAPGRNLASAQLPIAGLPTAYNFDPLRYIPCTANVVFVGSLDNAAGLGRTLVATDVGTTVGLTKDVSGIWYCDTNNASKAVLITALVDPVGTASGRVEFTVLQTTTVTAYA